MFAHRTCAEINGRTKRACVTKCTYQMMATTARIQTKK
jgi:hypothetical protein